MVRYICQFFVSLLSAGERRFWGFVHLSSFCFLVYSSFGFSHGKGRCPWRAAQQESLFHGRVPEEIWILKRPLPIHTAAHSLSTPLSPTCGQHYQAWLADTLSVFFFSLFFFPFFYKMSVGLLPFCNLLLFKIILSCQPSLWHLLVVPRQNISMFDGLVGGDWVCRHFAWYLILIETITIWNFTQ